MTLNEMKRKVLGLIEELNPNSEVLTDDPDIATKINDVINQVLYELARMKKIPKYFEMEVNEGDLITYADFESECGYVVYQLNTIGGVEVTRRANNTVFKVLESGTMEVDCFVYPERITDKTKGNYEFELSDDALEIMPYGVAADLLKSDVSAEYGNVYAQRYEAMKQMLDPRYQTSNITIVGGVKI